MELNKPIYIGVCILELSKLHMYQCYYAVLKKKFDDKINCFTMILIVSFSILKQKIYIKILMI